MPSVWIRSSQARSRGRPSVSTSSSYDGPVAGALQAPLAHERRPLVQVRRDVGQRDALDDPVAPERRRRHGDVDRRRRSGAGELVGSCPSASSGAGVVRALTRRSRGAGSAAPGSPRLTAISASISRRPSKASRA